MAPSDSKEMDTKTPACDPTPNKIGPVLEPGLETIPEPEAETEVEQQNQNGEQKQASKHTNDLIAWDNDSRRSRSHPTVTIIRKANDFTRRLSRNIEHTHNAIKTINADDPHRHSLVAYYEEKTNNEELDKDIDGGYALVILAVMFIINASTFGTARAYGLIFEKSVRDDATGRMEAAIPFTIMGAMENMSGPLAGYILTKFQSWRLTVVLGSSLVALAHLSAAYFNSLPGRITVMGVVCGFGTSLITISSFQINNAYFVKYRSRAFGFGLTGAAFGTLYISPLCRYVLDTYSTNACYIMLGLIILPNIALALLLRPKFQGYIKARATSKRTSIYSIASAPPLGTAKDLMSTTSTLNRKFKERKGTLPSIAGDIQKRCKIESHSIRLWYSIKRVLSEPIFHLIWPTQLIFCWLNFVIGMVVVDYARDRGLSEYELSYLIPIWALGQLIGRIGLGAVVDMKFVSYRMFTIMCLSSISLSLWLLGNVHHLFRREGTTVIVLVLLLSLFIANLYILFNGLVAYYIESELTAMSIGISSFISSFFLLPRAHVIGYYRDTSGNYDSMLDMFLYVTAGAALCWLIIPLLLRYYQLVWLEPRRRASRLQNIIDSNPWLVIPNNAVGAKRLHGNEKKSINIIDQFQIKTTNDNSGADNNKGNNNITIIVTESSPPIAPIAV